MVESLPEIERYHACLGAIRQPVEADNYLWREAQKQETPTWEAIAPMLDEGISRLSREDRDLIALRYFRGQPMADVAAAVRR